jgi:hypothetical protein
MATYTAPFQRDAIAEVVPRSLELSSLSKSSILTGRRRIRIIPQTGQTYGGPAAGGGGQPTIANILLQDSAGLLDMQSVVLSMDIKLTNTSINKANNNTYQTGVKLLDGNPQKYGPTGVDTAQNTVDAYLATAASGTNVCSLPRPAAVPNVNSVAINPFLGNCNPAQIASSADPMRTAVLDDFAWSVFRRIQISLNSQLVDDLDYCGRRATTEVYMSATPDWYQTIGTVMGAWKYVPTAAVVPFIQRPNYNTVLTTVAQIASYPLRSTLDSLRWANLLAVGSGVVREGDSGPALNTIPTPAAPSGGVGTGVPGTDSLVIADNPFGAYFANLAPGATETKVFNVAMYAVISATPSSVSGIVAVTVTAAAASEEAPTSFASVSYNIGVTGEYLNLFADGASNNRIAFQTGVSGGISAGTFSIYDQADSVADGGFRAMDVFGAAPASGPNALYPYVQEGPDYGLKATGNPLLGVPFAAGSVSREDVLGKVYNASAFFKNVYFMPKGQTTNAVTAGWYSARPNLASSAAISSTGLWTDLGDSGHKFSIPMGLLSHLFRQEQLFPLRNAGQLILQIQFADPVECCFGAPVVFENPGFADHSSILSTFGGTPQLSYTASNLELECDIVTAVPEYTAILDSICSRPADKGLAIAFDSHLSSLQQVTSMANPLANNALGGGSEQSFTLIASKGSENVRSFHFTLSPTAGLRNYEYLQNSTFPSYDMVQWQIRVGSVYYPAFPSKGLSKNYMEMLSSVNAPMPSVGQASMISYNMFRSSTPSPSWVAASIAAPLNSTTYAWDCGSFGSLKSVPVQGVPGVAGQAVIDPQCAAFSDGYIGGYCFDNLKHAEPLSHDGLDTRAIAGGMIQLDFTCRPLEAFAVVFHIRFTRTIVLAENGVSIVG